MAIAALVLAIALRPRGFGFVLGDPDEFIFMKLAESLRLSHWPIFGGQPFYYDLPLYPLTASFFLLITNNYLLATRLVSYVSTLVTAAVIYKYLRIKTGERVLALVAALLFLMLPLSVFYSQVGIIEPFLSLLLFSGIISFDLAEEEHSLPLAFLSGGLLGLAVLTKFTALVPLLIIVIYLVLASLRLTLRAGNLLAIRVHLNSLAVLSTAGIIFLPVILFFRLKDYAVFSYQIGTIFGTNGATGWAIFPVVKALLPDWLTAGNAAFWLTWLVIIAAGVGSFWLVSDRRFRLLTTVFTVLLYLVLARAPFHIRYLVILMPVLAICVSLGLHRFKLLGQLPLLLIFIATTLYLIGYNVKVLQASRQNILETAVAAVKLPRADFSGFIFSNYWPNILGYLAGTDRSSWLANNKREVEAYYPAAEADSFTLLKKYGGYVFIEEKFSQEISQPAARQEAIVAQLSVREPDKVISTTSPAFPYFREGGDRVLIYEYR